MTRSHVALPHPSRMRHGSARLDLGPRDAVPVAADDATLRVLDALARRTRGIHLVPAPETRARVVLAVDEGTDAATLAPPRGTAPDAVDERYDLRAEGGVVRITAPHRAGLVRGGTTLLHLVDVAERVSVDEVDIADAPRLAWRGLSLDVARCFFSVEKIERVIDLLAWHRMNVLHLHLSDSQAWRVESARYPELTAAGPSYSVAELRALDAYAAERLITVVPELDMPGHVHAALAALPQLAVETPHPAIAYLDADVAGVADFARDVLGELAEATSGPFLHLGGDEAFGMPAEAYARFVRMAIDHVHALGKRVVGWQETTRAGALAHDDLAQFWISDRDRFDAAAVKARTPAEHHGLVDLAAQTFAEASGDLARAVDAEVPVLVSSSFPLYLDRPYAGVDVPAEARAVAERVGFADYPPEPLATLAGWNPDAHVAAALAGARIAGVETAVWCETVESFDDLAFLLLPRLALVAERAWNPVELDWPEVAERLAAHGDVWDRLGFGARLRPAGAVS